jgi:hypothetical protein
VAAGRAGSTLVTETVRIRHVRHAAFRAALVIAVIIVGQGTSCVGPSVFVLHRFALTSRPDTSFAFPERVQLPPATYSLPAPKRHWWSNDPPRPYCRGFHLYTADWPPTYVVPYDREILPPYTFEARLTGGPEPTLVVWYRYGLPFNRIDSTTPEGAARRARIARLDTVFSQYADSVARAILAASGAQPVVPAAHVSRTQSWKEFDRWCRAATADTGSTTRPRDEES